MPRYFQLSEIENNQQDKTQNYISIKQTQQIPIHSQKDPYDDFTSLLYETSQTSKQIQNMNQRLKELNKSKLFKLVINRSTLFSTDEKKLNEMACQIKEGITQIQSNIHEHNQNPLIKIKSQQNIIFKPILEILQHDSLQLTNEFKKTLQIRTQHIKTSQQKKKKNPTFYSQNASTLTKRSGALFIKKEESHTNIQMDAQEQPQENRIESMRNIEKMIGEIGSIFQRLGNIVQMHEVMIDRIDRNTDQSLSSLEKGKKNINEVYQSTLSNRQLILKVFCILFVFVTFYIIFVI